MWLRPRCVRRIWVARRCSWAVGGAAVATLVLCLYVFSPDLMHLDVWDIHRDPGPRAILVFAYMRGGSTFTGNLLNRDPDVFYWYEFFWDVYHSMVSSKQAGIEPIEIVFDEDYSNLRDITKYEIDYIQRQTGLLFNCQLDQMPVEATTSWTQSVTDRYNYVICLTRHGGFDRFRNICHRGLYASCPGHLVTDLRNQCHLYMERTRLAMDGHDVQAVSGFPPISSYLSCAAPSRQAAKLCLPPVIQDCRERPVKMAKILRGNMSYMGKIREDFPRLKIVHLLRDPRGILMSRQKGFGQPVLNFDYSREARLLCRKMLEDIRQRQDLERRYPGLTIEVKYEALAKDATKHVTAIYDFTGIAMKNQTLSWLKTYTKSSLAIANGWKRRINQSIQRKIDAQCQDLYHATGYGS